MKSFSYRVNSMHAEDIKMFMKQSMKKKMISFAGGMPNNDLFPVKEIDLLYNELDLETKQICFQYGSTSGYLPLKKSLEKYLKKKGLDIDNNKILITTGSLQAISIIAQEFVNRGDIVLTENPCFVGALTVFETYGANIQGVPIDKDGIVISQLIEKLESVKTKPKFLYITPNFHNPAGIIYAEERKKALLQVLKKYQIMLIEDDAYSDLYFDDADKNLVKPIKSFKNGEVEIIYTGSFSKILGPGFRLGYMLSSVEIYNKAESIKQALDACTSNFTQILAHEFMRKNKLQPYLKFLRKEYKERKNIMQKALLKYMPKEIVWNEPKGGFYIWLKLPEYIKSEQIAKNSLKKGVIFIKGTTFDPQSKKDNCLRLSFSSVPKKDIRKGIKRLAQSIKKEINNIV